jgi:[ribosomal protein S5]-alanine N-acetyltransferase
MLTHQLYFESLEYERIEALALQIDYSLCRVLEKSGFVLEGVLRNFNKCSDEFRNVCYYAMIKSDCHKLQS